MLFAERDRKVLQTFASCTDHFHLCSRCSVVSERLFEQYFGRLAVTRLRTCVGSVPASAPRRGYLMHARGIGSAILWNRIVSTCKVKLRRSIVATIGRHRSIVPSFDAV